MAERIGVPNPYKLATRSPSMKPGENRIGAGSESSKTSGPAAVVAMSIVLRDKIS